jgi:hypothetical protein
VAGHPQPKPDLRNWAPRLAAAYRLPWSHDFVARGCYGLYWDRWSSGGVGAQEFFGGPFQILAQTYSAPACASSGQPAGQVCQPPFQFPAPFTSQTDNTINYGNRSQWLPSYPQQWRNGAYHNFNVGLEKEIAHIGLRASYIGSRGVHLIDQFWNRNKPQPSLVPLKGDWTDDLRSPNRQLAGWGEFLRDGKSIYNAFQFEAKRKTGFVTFDASYTLASDLGNRGQLDTRDVTQFYSKWTANGADTRNRVTLKSHWALPFGPGRAHFNNAPRPLGWVIGGWDVEHVAYFASGWLFSPWFCGNVNYTNTYYDNSYCGTPDMIPGANPYLPDGVRTNERWFNTAIYTCAAPDGQSCGINSQPNAYIPYVYQAHGAFMVPGCPTTDPLCLNTQQVAVGRYGNAPYNSLHGDPLQVHHLSFIKEFHVRERYKVTYTAMVSNLFNHAHYYNPDGTITDSGPNGTGCVAHLTQFNCGSAEWGGEYNHAGFRSIAMKLRVDF